MAQFRLTNQNYDSWVYDQFVELDPDVEKQLKKPVLCIKWPGSEARIEILPAYSGGLHTDIQGVSKTFFLPYNFDATRFPAYYEENVKPVLMEMRAYFHGGYADTESIGFFDFSEPIAARGQKEQDYYSQIQQLLRQAPRHEDVYHWSLTEVYPTASDLYLRLESYGIDLVEISLRSTENVREIRELLEIDCTFLMDDKGFMYELMQAQSGVDYETRKAGSTRKRVNAAKSRKIDRIIGDARTAELLNSL